MVALTLKLFSEALAEFSSFLSINQNLPVGQSRKTRHRGWL